MKRFTAFLAKYAPDYSRNDISTVYGYGVAQAMVQVLKQAGDDLTRANVMKQAANLKDFVPDIMLPGVKLNTSASDHYPIEQLQMMRFTGETWQPFGPVISGEINR
jgi:branched-chain amino acid transport system substrate-binding protein